MTRFGTYRALVTCLRFELILLADFLSIFREYKTFNSQEIRKNKNIFKFVFYVLILKNNLIIKKNCTIE